MRVVVVTGIWPPDPGGPASHAPALAAFLEGHGHRVDVVTTADREPTVRSYSVRWVSRRLPAGVRHVRVVALIRRSARKADVVYATSMVRRAALGAALAGRPLVVKLTTDEVFERWVRSGRYRGTIEEFQTTARGVRIRLLRRTRHAALRRASHVFCPSAYLRGIALGWELDADAISVLPNPAPELPDFPPREELRAELELEGPALAFAGRLASPKALGVALEAVARVDGVTLALAGEGPDRHLLEAKAIELGLATRVRFLGSTSREGVLRLFRAADAVLLSSAWENLPHAVVEALAVGTPVLATAVGGVPEVVRDGENGLLVSPGDPEALASAIQRFFGDDDLRRRLAEAAQRSVAAYTEEAVFGRIAEELARVSQL